MDEKTFSFSYNFETGASFTAVYIRFSAPRCLPSRRSASCVKYRYRVARVFRVLRNVICYIHRRERGWKKLTRGGKFFERKNELKRSYKHCSDASDSELLRGWKIQDSPVFWGIIPDYRFLFDFSACISFRNYIRASNFFCNTDTESVRIVIRLRDKNFLSSDFARVKWWTDKSIPSGRNCFH